MSDAAVVIDFLQIEVLELRDIVNQLKADVGYLQGKVWEYQLAFEMIDKGINDHADLHASLNSDIHQIRISADQISHMMSNRGKTDHT